MTELIFVEPSRLEALIVEAVEQGDTGEPQALFVVHVDRIREVNAQCGDDAVRALLRQVHGALGEHMGTEAHAARIEVDRVAYLLPGCVPDIASTIAHRICTKLEDTRFAWQGLEFRLGVTVAILEVDAETPHVAGLLARAAETSLTADALGGDGVVFTHGRADEISALESERDTRDHLRDILA